MQFLPAGSREPGGSRIALLSIASLRAKLLRRSSGAPMSESRACIPSGFDVARLLTPAAFAHPVGELKLEETHLSWLILTGPFAYKIKKPLRLEYIDAVTLARRHYLCDEELRLNSNLAADLYVDVVPITADGDQLRIGGSGKPIEYAVRMRQFVATDELDHLLDANDVSINEIAGLADLLASFHESAPPAASNDPNVAVEHTFDIVLGNLAVLVEQLERSGSSAPVSRIARWLQERLESERATLEQRAMSGHVRDCHGDLHSGNVVRFQQRLVPFDRLEFNARLRSIDVLDDLAFLVMDLSGHDRDDLALVLLSRYLEHSGDYAGLQLVPLYAVHRALVRAKIDALSVHAIPERAVEFQARLQRRLRGADYWSTSRQPALVLMHGVSGSGKSWLSEQLVPALPAIRIRSDLERKRLAGIGVHQSAFAAFQSGIYSPQFSHRTYAHLCECAEAALRGGFNVIVDAAFLDATDRELFRGLARRLGIQVAIVACSAAPEVLAKRIEARTRTGDGVSDANSTVLAEQLRQLQPFAADEQSHVITVNTQDDNALELATAGFRLKTGTATNSQ